MQQIASNVEQVITQTIEDSFEYLDLGVAHFIRRQMGDAVEMEASGCYITDARGNRYLDAFTSMGVFGMGHRHPDVVQAVKDQLDRMPIHGRWFFFNIPQAALGKLLASIAPRGLKRSFFCNSASEAVETALKFARLASGKKRLVGTEEAYHGLTMGALSVTGSLRFRKGLEPLVPDCDLVPYGDIEAMKRVVGDDTAAIILEPVQSGLGAAVPPPDYFPQVRQLCDERGVYLISDETQTGLGRTGKMFGIDHYGVAPDLMVLGKTLSGGVVPVGCCMYTEEITKKMGATGVPFNFHTSTFGGGEMACAAAKATIEVILRDKLVQRVSQLGDYFEKQLLKLKDDYPQYIKSIRGQGFMRAVEFVEPPPALAVLADLLRRHRVLVGVGPVLGRMVQLRLTPPLIAEQPELDLILAALRSSLEKLSQISPEEFQALVQTLRW